MNKKVTIIDVAKKSGYGVGTVSRVISGDKSVKDSTRVKIRRVIDELNYVPNVNGARLRREHTGVIALMVPVINHPFFAEFVEGVEAAANDNGYSLLLITSQNNEEKEGETLLKIRRKEIDGAIIVTHYEHDEEELKGCPLVSIDRHLGAGVPLVTSDNYDSAKAALERLYANGRRRIGFLGTKPNVPSEVALRKQAYDDFVKEKGLPSLAKWAVVDHGEEIPVVEEFLNEFPDLDAIFASNCILAVHAYRFEKKKGRRFPEDVELIAYDGLSAPWEEHSISCVRQNIPEMGKTAFRLLMERIAGRETEPITIIPTQWIPMETTIQSNE